MLYCNSITDCNEASSANAVDHGASRGDANAVDHGAPCGDEMWLTMAHRVVLQMRLDMVHRLPIEVHSGKMLNCQAAETNMARLESAIGKQQHILAGTHGIDRVRNPLS